MTVQGVKTTRTTVRLPVGTKKNIPSNFDVIGTLGRYIISCWVLRAACFYTYSNEVMYAQQFSMMMNKMNQSRRENVKVDIKLEKCISTSNPTFLTTAVHSICAYLSFCLWAVKSFQDFLIKLDMKPLMHLLEISIFSLNIDIVRLTKTMNNVVNDLKILSIKVISV